MICTFCRLEKGDNFYQGRLECKECRIWKEHATKEQRKDRAEKLVSNWNAEYSANKPWLSRASGPWLPLPSYERLYEVSSDGKVISLWFGNGFCRYPRVNPLLLKMFVNKIGYHSFTAVGEDGKHTTIQAHQAVMMAFSPEHDEDRWHVAHIDGNGSNNNMGNLRWSTPQENEADKARHGRNLAGSKNHQAKLNEEIVARILTEDAATPCREIGRKYGISSAVAFKIIKRAAWKHVEPMIVQAELPL